jgi:hypothetical protein
MALPLIAFKLASLVAPTLVGLLKGPKAEATAQKVIDVARQVTGIDDPEKAAEALEASSVATEAYRLALLKHEEFRLQLEADDRKHEREHDSANIANARTRDVEVRKVAGGYNWRADAMVGMAAIGLVCSLVGMVALGWMKAQHPEAITEGVFAALLTQFANTGAYFGLCLRDAFTFEFGSSRGSRIKDERDAGQPVRH